MVLTGERMFIYFATALIVCLMTLVKGQYYGNQPPPQPQPPSPQYSQQQQNSQQHNSEAWRRWYYQQRQRQQQHSAYSSSRGQQSAPMASPAANSQNPSYYNQRQPQPQYSQQQYYQQRQPGSYGQPQGYGPPPPQGYGPPQSYNYGNYQPAPVTPPPLTTPAEKQAAFGARSPSITNKESGSPVSYILSSAAQAHPAMRKFTGQNSITNFRSNPGLSRAVGYSSRNVHPGLAQAQQLNNILLRLLPDPRIPSIPNVNSRIGAMPQVANPVQIGPTYTQPRAGPHSYIQPAAYSGPMRNNANSGVGNQRNFQNTGNSHNLTGNKQGWGVQAATVQRATSFNTTTPKVAVVTEPLEYEGPTTTAKTPLSQRLNQAFQVPQIQAAQQSPRPSPVQPASNYQNPPYQQSPMNPNVYQPPFDAVGPPPPGYISIDAIRADLITAIQLLTNDIAVMANTTSIGELSFLLGKFASKLPPKMSSNSKNTIQSSQNTAGGYNNPGPPQGNQKPSEWAGIFDAAPGQPSQGNQGNWHKGNFPERLPPPSPASKLQNGFSSLQTTQLSPQQNQQQLDPQLASQSQQQQPQQQQQQQFQDLVTQQPQSTSWQNRPLQPAPQAPPVEQNVSTIYEPPPVNANPNSPLDLPGPQHWQMPPPPEVRPPQTVGQSSWREQPFQPPTNVNQHQHYHPPPNHFSPPQPHPMETNQAPSLQQPQLLDMPQRQPEQAWQQQPPQFSQNQQQQQGGNQYSAPQQPHQQAPPQDFGFSQNFQPPPPQNFISPPPLNFAPPPPQNYAPPPSQDFVPPSPPQDFALPPPQNFAPPPQPLDFAPPLPPLDFPPPLQDFPHFDPTLQNPPNFNSFQQQSPSPPRPAPLDISNYKPLNQPMDPNAPPPSNNPGFEQQPLGNNINNNFGPPPSNFQF